VTGIGAAAADAAAQWIIHWAAASSPQAPLENGRQECAAVCCRSRWVRGGRSQKGAGCASDVCHGARRPRCGMVGVSG
jgi:hypothetical protein